MTITTLDGLIAAPKQKIAYMKTGVRTTIANAWFSMFDLAGQPGAGTLAIGNTANGVVPDDTIAGYPAVNSFGASAQGYLNRVEFANTVACRVALFDRVFAAGAYAFNANTTLATIPSYSARLADTANYNDLEIWVETVAAPTGNLAVNVTYTNQAGTGSRTTGATGIGAQPTVGRCWQLPLQAGDSGVQQINTIVGSVASAGAGVFNVMVLRPLWSARIIVANSGDVHDMLKAGMSRVYDTSALYVMINADSTSSGAPEFSFGIANG